MTQVDVATRPVEAAAGRIRPGQVLPLVHLPDGCGRLVPLVPAGPATVLLLGDVEQDEAALAHHGSEVAVAPGAPRARRSPVPVLHDVRGDLGWILGLGRGTAPTRLTVDADRVVTRVEVWTAGSGWDAASA